MRSNMKAGSVSEAVPLAPLTTLRIGPVAHRMITCDTTEALIAVMRQVGSDLPADRLLILGGGSNTVVADDLTELTVVRVANREITVEGNRVRVQAGAVWDDVVVAAMSHGLGGLECLSGIPGTAGATPIQNVGAYGVEVAQAITRVRLLNRRSGNVRWVDPEELRFGYRTSVLKNSTHAVVLEVEFGLDPTGRSAPLHYRDVITALGVSPGDRCDPFDVRDAVLGIRRANGMVLDDGDHDTWSVGSFFTYPVVPRAEFERIQELVDTPVPHHPTPNGIKLVAEWLIEQAGFAKGYPGNGARARLSTKQALSLTNRGAASSSDVIALARQVRDGVAKRFGIVLTPEPSLVGCAL